MATRLTETAINRAIREAPDTGRKDLADAGAPGLRLRVSPPSQRMAAGEARWVLACRDNAGAMRRFPVGQWPDMGVSDAREAARALRATVRAGADPIAERRVQRVAARDAKEGVGTLAAFIDLYGRKATRKDGTPGGEALRTWPEMRRKMDLVFAPHMKRAVASLTAEALQMTADEYPAASSASAAVRYLRPALRWGVRRKHLPAGLAGIEAPGSVKQRKRVLTREELEKVLPVLAKGATPYHHALRFMLLTLVRRDEACSARWRDVDMAQGVWIIPVTKNDQAHVLTLPVQAMAMLRAIGPGVADELIFGSSHGKKLSNWDRATKAVHAESETGGWHRHDLRRTGATLLGQMGTPPHVIEAALNHIALHSRLAAGYNQARYAPEVAAALQRLADHLDGIITGGATVTDIAAARARAAGS